MIRSIKSPPSLSHLAGNALPGGNAAYLFKTNYYSDGKVSFIDIGNGFRLPVIRALNKHIIEWAESLVMPNIVRHYPNNDDILKEELTDSKTKAVQVVLSPDTDSLGEYLAESRDFNHENVDLSQLEFKTNAIRKTALIKLEILRVNNWKKFSSDTLELIIRHVQTILDFPNQKERFFVEPPTGFSKEFIESFFNAIDSIDYKIPVSLPQYPKQPACGTTSIPLKEAVFLEIIRRTHNGDIPEFLLDAMPRTSQAELLFYLTDLYYLPGLRDFPSKLFRRLLDQGLITATGNNRATLLHETLKNINDNPEAVGMLLQHKDIDRIINTCNSSGCTPLDYYLRGKHGLNDQFEKIDQLGKILKAGADGILESNPDNGSKTTIWNPNSSFFSDWGEDRYDKLYNLLFRFDKVKQWINDPNKQGETALYEAVRSCKLETVMELIHSDASVQYVNARTGQNVLHLAKTAEMVEFLIKNGAKPHINSADNLGNTPLHMAVIDFQTEVVEALLRNGADIKAINPQTGENVLHVFPLEYHMYTSEISKMIELLINLGAKDLINSPDRKGKIPLYNTLYNTSGSMLMYQNQIEMMEKLLKYGNYSGTVDLPNGDNIWHLAVREINPERNVDKFLKMFEMLSKFGVETKINCRNANGERPLDLFMKKFDVTTVETELSQKKRNFASIYRKLIELGAITEREGAV